MNVPLSPPRWMPFFLALLNMFIPLATDLYLPALPSMSSQFQTSLGIVNLTLSVFFLAYAAGVLFFGPLSDQHGRKPILVAGLIIFLASTLVAALAPTITILIVARAVEGIGAGGVTSVSMAMVKDLYQGKRRQSILAVTQTLSGLAPMVAPVLGAWILLIAGWRSTFYVLFGIGALALVLAVIFRESLAPADRYRGTLAGALKTLVQVGRKPAVLSLVLIFGALSIPFMGYLSLSSFIYVDQFGLSEQQYSWFFAGNALLSMAGPFVYVRFFSSGKPKNFALGTFLATVLSGLLVLLVGAWGPFWFLATFAVLSLASSTSRTFSTNLIFDQHDGDSGALASVMGTVFTVLGSLGMGLASLFSGNLVSSLGWLILVTGVLALGAWILLLASKVPLKGIKDAV